MNCTFFFLSFFRKTFDAFGPPRAERVEHWIHSEATLQMDLTEDGPKESALRGDEASFGVGDGPSL